MVKVYLVSGNSKTLIAEQNSLGYEISTARVRQSLNEVASATIRCPATNTHTDAVIALNRPVIEIRDNLTRVFTGVVVLTKKDIYGNVEFECDGALSFLGDIVKAPFRCNDKTKSGYIAAIIAQYNTAILASEHTERQVQFGGAIGFTDGGFVDIDHHDEYVDTLTLLKEAVAMYGGYFVEIYGTNQPVSFVWFEDITADSGKVLEFGVNEISLSDQFDFSEYASRVYATDGDGNESVAFDQFAETAFGRRDYALKVDNIPVDYDPATYVYDMARFELADRKDPVRSIELSALDLAKLGEKFSGFVLGMKATANDKKLGLSVSLRVNTIERDYITGNGSIVLGHPRRKLTDSFIAKYEVSGREKYSLANVESYFQNSVDDLTNTLNGLSGDWQNFVFITDTHGSGNKQHSQAIGLYLLNHAPVSMLVLGGDYSVENWSKEEYDNYMSPLVRSDKSDMIYALMGNHEHWYEPEFNESRSSIYNDFLKDKRGISGDLLKNYYYFDRADTKTRFMFINTSDAAIYTVSEAQIAWITQTVQLPSSEWSLVVIGHVPITNLGGMTGSNPIITNGAAVVNAIAGCNGNIVGYVCGHMHVDYLHDDGNFQTVTLICDKFENIDYQPGISVTDRQVGTVSEQAVSVISFNTTTRQVVIRRIGAGRNATFSYSY